VGAAGAAGGDAGSSGSGVAGVVAGQAATAGSPGQPATAGSQSTAGTGGSAGIVTAGAGGTAAVSGGSAASSGKLTAQIVARAIPPGGEEHVCVITALENSEQVWVNEVHASLSGGSHHLIVDREDPAATLQATPQPCSPTMAGDSTRLIIAQQRETEVKLPDGVAFSLVARQPLFLQLHYINLKDAPADITGTVELTLVDTKGGAPIEAKSRFTGATNINIPARGMSTVKSFFLPEGAGSSVRVFGVTSHTHRLGIKSTIERVANMNAPAATPVHQSLDWAEPPLTQFAPPLTFNGSDGFRLTCEYRNDTDEAVTFGVLAEQEMCFMWLYYYEQ
jgi:hypothetical protein